MKKNMILLGVCFFMLASFGSAVAAPPPNPARELVVSMPGEGGEYESINAALADAVNPTATNRYLIKVMPGSYDEYIEMKPFVDIVGSGRENTTITSTDPLNWTTIWGAANTTLRNIGIENRNSSDYRPSAVYMDCAGSTDVCMTFDSVKVVMYVPAGSGEAYGIWDDSNANSTISNSEIIVINEGAGGRGSLGIGSKGNKLTVLNSVITVDSSQAAYTFWNVGIQSTNSTTVVKDCIISVTGAEYNSGLDNSGQPSVSVSNSRVEVVAMLNTTHNDAIISGGGSYTIYNSEIVADVNGSTATNNAVNAQNAKIGSSLVDGDIQNPSNVILVNSWDADFRPIANTLQPL